MNNYWYKLKGSYVWGCVEQGCPQVWSKYEEEDDDKNSVFSKGLVNVKWKPNWLYRSSLITNPLIANFHEFPSNSLILNQNFRSKWLSFLQNHISLLNGKNKIFHLDKSCFLVHLAKTKENEIRACHL